jgi:hypothetical protein
MTRMPNVQIRMPESYVARAEVLAEQLQEDLDFAASGGPTRSAVLRVAVSIGLAALEEKVKPASGRRRR